jgi:hypothetical protein
VASHQTSPTAVSWAAVAPALGVAAGVIALGALTGFSARGPWDDAYMFVRYAAHLIQYRTLAWDPGGEPTYGLTSVAYLLLVVPLRLIGGDSPALILVLASALGGMAFLVLLAVAVSCYGHAGEPRRRLSLLLVLVVIAMSIHRFAPHLVSGMDTTFALAFVAAYIVLLQAYEARGTRLCAAGLAAVGSLAFWVRPDLLLYTLGVPLGLILLGRAGRARRQAVGIVAVVVLATAVQIALSWRYFRSPLPLAFYAKSLPHYGDFFHSRYRFFGLRELGHYLESFWPFLAILVGAWLVEPRLWWRRASPGEKGLMLATVAFLLYYATAVLQIMGYHQRFYYPTLPALAFLSVRALDGLVASAEPWSMRWAPRWRWLLSGLVLGILLPQTLVMGTRLVSEFQAGWIGRFDVAEYYRASHQHLWFKLDEFSRLPDDLVMATTEIGLPAALNPRKRIVDLAGLNEPALARDGVSILFVIYRDRPDLIYLPHPDYRDMIAQLLHDPGFRTTYEVLDARALGAVMGLALRRASTHYGAMRAIVGGTASALPRLD